MPELRNALTAKYDWHNIKKNASQGRIQKMHATKIKVECWKSK